MKRLREVLVFKMFGVIGRALTSDYVLGAAAGVLISFIVFFHDPSGSLWAEAKTIQPIIAGVFAIAAGYYIWAAKQLEILEENRREQAFSKKFKHMFLSELEVLSVYRDRLCAILSNDDSCDFTYSVLRNAGVFIPFKLFTTEDDRYIRYLDLETIEHLVELESDLSVINKNLALYDRIAIDTPDNKFNLETKLLKKLNEQIEELPAKIQDCQKGIKP